MHHDQTPGPVYLRFTRSQRLLHAAMMTSFLGLAFTGLPLLFSDAPWARVIARLLGGFNAAGILHRLFASVMITCFVVHVFDVMRRVFVKKDLRILWGPESMVPQPSDVLEMLQHMRWFLRLGPRPKFDHFTYWEKFDYWAVFWGMAVIGTSGFFLWFPAFFSRFVPGWAFNIAMLIHGEEALLAVGFIFTIHFFNSHLRPEKFPMDPVFITGRVGLGELRDERPAEFERLTSSGRLRLLEVRREPAWVRTIGKIGATLAVTLGLVMVVLILFALLGGGN